MGTAVGDRPSEPRVTPVDPAELTGPQRALAGIGASNVIRTLVRRDDLLAAMNPLGTALLTAGRMPVRDRELAILRVAWRTRSAYEWGNHVLAALGGGVPDADVTAVADPSATWSDADAALLRAVDELCADDCLTDGTWAALARTRDDGELIELLLVVGYYRLMAGVLNSLGVPVEEGRPALGATLERPPSVPARPVPAGDAAGDPDGRWDVTFHHPAGDQRLTLVLRADGGRLTGSATNAVNGLAVDVAQGTVDGGRFSFTAVLTEPMRLEMTYTGAVSGDSMAGAIAIRGVGDFPFDGVRT